MHGTDISIHVQFNTRMTLIFCRLLGYYSKQFQINKLHPKQNTGTDISLRMIMYTHTHEQTNNAPNFRQLFAHSAH